MKKMSHHSRPSVRPSVRHRSSSPTFSRSKSNHPLDHKESNFLPLPFLWQPTLLPSLSPWGTELQIAQSSVASFSLAADTLIYFIKSGSIMQLAAIGQTSLNLRARLFFPPSSHPFYPFDYFDLSSEVLFFSALICNCLRLFQPAARLIPRKVKAIK
jgi:hypothetical protein